MKTLTWGFIFFNLLLAINICEGNTTELNHRRVKRNNRKQQHSQTSQGPKKPATQQHSLKPSGRRISETKCLEYIRDRIQQERALRNKYPFVSFSIGGRNALQGEFPHMGALGWRTRDRTWSFKCGSSLISHKFALTAAHCSKIPLSSNLVKKEPEIVRFGDNNIIYVSNNPVDANILRIIVHPQYLSPNKYYDIALIEFRSTLQFTKYIQPVCLWNRFDTSSLGTKVSSTGWGVLDIKSKKPSEILQAIEINLIDSELCNRLLRQACNKRWCGIRKHQICAGKLSGGVDACKGDSGGPLQVKKELSNSAEGTAYFLIGVTSFGVGCARPNFPGVYTRVSSFIDWIERIVWS